MNKSTSLPVTGTILSIKHEISNQYSTNSLPPPLECGHNDENNKENMWPPKITKKRKSAFDDSVPELELIPDSKLNETSPNVERVEVNEIKQPLHDAIIPVMASSEEAVELIINEECQESGDVAVSSTDINNNNNNNADVDRTANAAADNTVNTADPVNNNTNNTNNTNNANNANNTNNNNLNNPAAAAYMLTSNGRLLESEAVWYRRPKVTHTESGMMNFRALRMRCTHCEEAYTKTHDLYAHIRTHQNHTKCPHCGKILTCMATFVYHVRTHTSEKPYYCPCDGCDFKNAVKYNLKVHLACIRHGGKDNLKKYAKVLDLDVCEKSLRKRKDNSVHELGSRRSKRRRKDTISMDTNAHAAPITSSQYHYPKQEECDQYTAQLLFSLSGIPPVFDQNMGMNQVMNQGLVDWSSILASNAVKSEPAISSNLADSENVYGAKPVHYPSYDPLYHYYGFSAAQNAALANLTNAQSMSAQLPQSMSAQSMSASTLPLWSDEKANSTDANSDPVLVPKQEPVYQTDYAHNAYAAANHQQQMQHAMMQQNMYYGNYYLNYNDAANHNLASYTNQVNQQMQLLHGDAANNNENNDDNNKNNNNSNNNQCDLPPLQFGEFE